MESIKDYDTVYKIGYSKNPKKRLNNVQTGNDGLVRVLYEFRTGHGKKLETALHNFYSHKNTNMEWFALDIEEVANFIPLCEKTEKNLDVIEKSDIDF